MKSNIKFKRILGIGLVAIGAVLLSGCPGGSSSSGGGGGTSTDLKGALFPTLSPATSVITTVLSQARDLIGDTDVTYTQNVAGIAGFGSGQLGGSGTTDLRGKPKVGVTSFTVPAGTYTARLEVKDTEALSPASGVQSTYSTIETVSGSGSVKTYQTDKYSMVINAPVTMKEVTVLIYQTDSIGNITNTSGRSTAALEKNTSILQQVLRQPKPLNYSKVFIGQLW